MLSILTLLIFQVGTPTLWFYLTVYQLDLQFNNIKRSVDNDEIILQTDL